MTPVIFDLDGTLIDSLPDITDAANALLAGEGLPPVTMAMVRGFVGLGVEVFMDRLTAATDLRAEDRARLMPAFIAHYETAAEETRLFPGARAALDALAARGHPLGLCTNKPGAPLRHTLRAAGLKATFGAVVAGDTLPRRKPDPAPLHHAMTLLGATRCLYVGDSETDAETARAAGVPFLLYAEGIRVSPVDAIPHDLAFDDFVVLPDLVAELG